MGAQGSVNASAISNGDMKGAVSDAALNSVYTILPAFWTVRVAEPHKPRSGVGAFACVENQLNQCRPEIYGYKSNAGDMLGLGGIFAS